MRNLLRFIIRHHFAILFIIIETISISLVVRNNSYHKSVMFEATNSISGYIFEQFHSLEQYLELKRINKKLIEENLNLRRKVSTFQQQKSQKFQHDSLSSHRFKFISAKVINNSTNKQFNYITIDKGEKAGIKSEMGVISSDGVVGIVQGTSKNYASVISLLNRKLKISAKIKDNDYFGSLSWTGEDPQTASLDQIPYHVTLEEGDTIVTSGYSAIFPENILIGHISDFNIKGGNFYNITVELSTDFKQLSYVYIIKVKNKQEQQNLENKYQK